VRVAWYTSVGAMVRGLEKNSFAGFDYRVHRLVALTAAYGLIALGPWLGLTMGDGITRLLCGLAAGSIIAVHAWYARHLGWSPVCAWLAPVASLVLLWLWWRACLLTLWRGKVSWRGTHYPLTELRNAHDRILQH